MSNSSRFTKKLKTHVLLNNIFEFTGYLELFSLVLITNLYFFF